MERWHISGPQLVKSSFIPTSKTHHSHQQVQSKSSSQSLAQTQQFSIQQQQQQPQKFQNSRNSTQNYKNDLPSVQKYHNDSNISIANKSSDSHQNIINHNSNNKVLSNQSYQPLANQQPNLHNENYYQNILDSRNNIIPPPSLAQQHSRFNTSINSNLNFKKQSVSSSSINSNVPYKQNAPNPLYGNLMGPSQNQNYHPTSSIPSNKDQSYNYHQKEGQQVVYANSIPINRQHNKILPPPPPPLSKDQNLNFHQHQQFSDNKFLSQHSKEENFHYSQRPLAQHAHISHHQSTIQPVINQIQQQHHSTKILEHIKDESGSSGENLPASLVESMRTLFDILDDKKEGRVRLSDIESRWENSEGINIRAGNTGAEPLIKMGVIGYLQKVTPPDGMLSFERFCTGLKLALFPNNSKSQLPKNEKKIFRPTTLSLNNNNNDSANQRSRIPSTNNNTATLTPSKLPMLNSSSANLSISPKEKFSTAKKVNLVPSNGLPDPPESSALLSKDSSTMSKNSGFMSTLKLTKPSLLTPPTSKSSVKIESLKGGLSSNFEGQSKNGSLDNLQTKSEREKNILRPPSAPLLDAKDEDEDSLPNSGWNTTKRQRARSRDREIDETKRRSKSPGGDENMNFTKRVVSFVTPRQRTLSMPQLQPQKLKSRGEQLDDDNISTPSSSSASPLFSGDKKIGALKSKLKPHAKSSSKLSLTHHQPEIDKSSKIETLLSKEKESKVIPAPPKPPRNHPLPLSVPQSNSEIGGSDNNGHLNSNNTNPTKPEIRMYLQSWKDGVTVQGESRVGKDDTLGLVDKKIFDKNQKQELSNSTSEVKFRSQEKRANLRLRESARRHTVQSGIDFNTLKRLKLMEQERDLLQQGLNFIEKGKEWYTKELELIDEKITQLTKGALNEHWSESEEEKLNLLEYRITEVNLLLSVLLEGSHKLPTHMNLQVPSHLNFRTLTRLREQNRQLTIEVSDCSQRVTQLETEKAMLLRQLFHQKTSTQQHTTQETVYM